jgi:salicylate hydroxylase
MPPPRPLIIGCGVAGPVLALLLKQKGYSPIILERVKELGDAGASLMLQPNGLKVLSLLGLSSIATETSPSLGCMKDITSKGEELGGTDFLMRAKERFGEPMCGVKRVTLNLILKDACVAAGIPVLEGWKLQDIIEDSKGVTAISSDGRKEHGDFLIGCDGLKSATRKSILKGYGIDEAEASFTGLIQIAGMSPTPPLLKEKPAMRNWYGNGAHLIAYPVSFALTSWAITQRSNTEEVETWQQMSVSQLEDYKKSLLKQFADWCEPIQELITGAERIIKYGLYDRPHIEAEKWVSREGRYVVIGDAAHPTSPHLGQGANQALEDCWCLANLLPDVLKEGEGTREGKELSSAVLRKVFLELVGKRQPRTKALVEGARKQGERRVVDGEEKCRERDEGLRRGWEDQAGVEARFDSLWKEPF